MYFIIWLIIISSIENSVDPDQLASSDLDLHYLQEFVLFPKE